MTEYTINQIKDAGASPEVIAKLTKPKHNFAVGQVVFTQYLEDDQPTGGYFRVSKCDLIKRLEGYRAQNLTEHGPDVRALQRTLRLIRISPLFDAKLASLIDKTLHKHEIPE